MPEELRARLDAASDEPKRFPYTFFGPELQGMLTGGVTVGDKPAGYHPDRLVVGAGDGRRSGGGIGSKEKRGEP